MLFNPNAERFTFFQLRSMAINTRDDLKERLDECLREKRFAQDMYVQCKKDDHDQQVFAAEMKALDDYLDRIDKTAYRQITHHLLAQESLYGFGTPLPITPHSAIEVILPHYWLFLELAPDKSEAKGHGLHYVGVFFQRKEDVPPETVTLTKERQSNMAATISTQQSLPPEKPENAEKPFYISPYLQLLLDAAQYFDRQIFDPHLKKDNIMAWLRQEAANRGFELSNRNVGPMATAIRPIESQKGGVKSYSDTANQGDTQMKESA